MNTIDSIPTQTFWEEDSFQIIRPEQFKRLGIELRDIPMGTFASLKHPSQLQSRFGGNAYGFGLYEVYDRLKPKDLKLIQSIALDNSKDIKKNYKTLNRIYKEIGLLIRFSSIGKFYYLIPVHLISNTLTHIHTKVEEITKIVRHHNRKYYKEQYTIGLVTHPDDLISSELALRFKEHKFVVIDSLNELRNFDQILDLIVFTRDLYEIIRLGNFSTLSQELDSRKHLDQYGIYILWKLYNLLKPNGEIYIVANHYTPKTNKSVKVVFKTLQEEKNFGLFTHIFKTKKKYTVKNKVPIQVNVFDFQQYLSALYVEQKVINDLLGGKLLNNISLKEINKLPYLNFQLSDNSYLIDQEKNWSRLLSIFFNRIFLKPLVPNIVQEDWDQKFSFSDYIPNYLMTYLGQKKPLEIRNNDIKKELLESNLTGCSPNLIADYRDSFDYLINSLNVLKRLKKNRYFKNLSQLYIDRLRQPLENSPRRFKALNNVILLISKIKRLEKIESYLNPDNIDGPKTKVLKHIEILSFFGFGYGELKEAYHIVLGHTTMERIISGKMNEKSLKPLSDCARTYDPQTSMNLIRYCRLMSMAEIVAFSNSELIQEQLTELFYLNDLIVQVVSNLDFDWDRLLDEKTIAMGGIRNKLIRKLLMMINHLEFLYNWSDLTQKGPMEKEALADYNDRKLSRIENVIRLIKSVQKYEDLFLRVNSLQFPIFIRKFLNIEFHGTKHLFERMNSECVTVLLWITTNLMHGESINFNPVLGDMTPDEIDNQVMKLEEEAMSIKPAILSLTILDKFREHLHKVGTSFIIGTGIFFKIDSDSGVLNVNFIDMDQNIEKFGAISKKIEGCLLSDISLEELFELEKVFSNLESFYQCHFAIFEQPGGNIEFSDKQNEWFKKVKELREFLSFNILNVIFYPKNIYSDLNQLYHHAPSILNFILPEFTALKDIDYTWYLYLRLPITNHILIVTRKLQALIRNDMDAFQDVHYLHTLAQKEFGALATGIVGINDAQVEALEQIVNHLSKNQSIFDALTYTCIFQEIGRAPHLRKKYKDKINPANLAEVSSFFLEMEKIPERYYLDKEGKSYLLFLVKVHGLTHHILRGEFSLDSLHEVLIFQDKDIFDAFFVFSFIMLSAIREDLIQEDLANKLFFMRRISHNIIDQKITLSYQLEKIYIEKGRLFCALEAYEKDGLPQGFTPTAYLEACLEKGCSGPEPILPGKMIFALERFFSLAGIRYIEFSDLVNEAMKLPLRYIYTKRKFFNVGFATFQREFLEAKRIYKVFHQVDEQIRHFILNQLDGDKVRIFGYEKIRGYLTYLNQIKFILVGFLGAKMIQKSTAPISINFLPLTCNIENRYEAVNDFFNKLHIEQLWSDDNLIKGLFDANMGISLKNEDYPNIISIDFKDVISVSQKISYMKTINNIAQLKKFFHNCLRDLRAYPFYTEDYEILMEDAFKLRQIEVNNFLLSQTKKQMNIISEFAELHKFIDDLLEKSLEIGFTSEQKHQLTDLYELRKDTLKGAKLLEIKNAVSMFNDSHALKGYWDGLKWYLKSNRKFIGKEFENLIAKEFSLSLARIENQS